MDTYQAIELSRFAPTFRSGIDLVDLKMLLPGPGEIRVRNLWCGVNGIFDTQIARNAVDYVKVRLPSVMGVEAAGVVESIGAGVTDFAVGDAAATVRFTGGYRLFNTGPAANFAKLPAPTREWLALASTGVSALLALEHIGEARAGETVVITAAAGGLGHLLVQLALLKGCHVVGICGGPRKAAFVRALGAHRVIDYKSEAFAAVLADEYGGKINLGIDSVGGELFNSIIDNIAPHGRLVVAGAAQDMNNAPGASVGRRVIDKLYYKAASVRGFMNGLLTELWPEARARIFALHASGQIGVTFDDVEFRGLAAVPDAVERLLSGQSMGKVIVRLQD